MNCVKRLHYNNYPPIPYSNNNGPLHEMSISKVPRLFKYYLREIYSAAKRLHILHTGIPSFNLISLRYIAGEVRDFSVS